MDNESDGVFWANMHLENIKKQESIYKTINDRFTKKYQWINKQNEIINLLEIDNNYFENIIKFIKKQPKWECIFNENDFNKVRNKRNK